MMRKIQKIRICVIFVENVKIVCTQGVCFGVENVLIDCGFLSVITVFNL